MIIDSHAHYNHKSYQNIFRYLTRKEEQYALEEGDREQLFQALAQGNVRCAIEPGISLESCPEILDLCRAHPGRLFPAMGVHPTRCVYERWSQRRLLRDYAQAEGVVAIGETGLDYHFVRRDQHRLRQYLWFFYQLGLARKVRKPLILHVRLAHRQALRVLRHHPARKLGGVIHCFYGSWEVAKAYLDLGYHIGIGGSLLQQADRCGDLPEAVAKIPLDRILLETDAPFILPYCKDVLPGKALRRARNTSLILPAVIERIAELKGISPEEVERVTAENAIRLFRLPIR